MEVFIQTNDFSQDITNYAEKLGGICQNEAIGDRLIEQHFMFQSESMAQQFDRSVRVFPEVIHIGSSPDLIKEAIANSKLCPCGRFTVLDCGIECEGMLDQIIDLKREFPKLEELRRGDRYE
jgi:hypothetical protein